MLASQYSFQWFRKAREEEEDVREEPVIEKVIENIIEQPKQDPHVPGWMFTEQSKPYPMEEEEVEEVIKEFDRSKHAYLDKPFVHFENTKPMVVENQAPEDEEQVILDTADENEKAAMSHWKKENPNGSLKSQRRLLERGVISELPWQQYLRPTADFDNEAAKEAAKWAQEQLEKTNDESADESKKKDSDVDRKDRQSTDSKNTEEVTYQQNAEQNKSTLWQRVKAKKNVE